MALLRFSSLSAIFEPSPGMLKNNAQRLLVPIPDDPTWLHREMYVMVEHEKVYYLLARAILPKTKEEKIITCADNLIFGAKRKDINKSYNRFLKELGKEYAERIKKLYKEVLDFKRKV